MKTIEERAKQWATDYPKTPDATYTNNDIEAIAENSFIQGATEQKAIDDAERDTAVYNLLLLKLDNKKKLWLDKACKWMEKELLKLSMDEIKENFLDNEFKVVLKSDIPKWIRNFHKALEK